MAAPPSIIIAQVINWVILALIPAAGFLVGRDARRRGKTGSGILMWVIISMLTFPVRVGLYLLLRTRNGQAQASSQDRR